MSDFNDSYGVDEHTDSEITEDVICYATSDSFENRAVSIFRPLLSGHLEHFCDLDKLMEIVFIKGETCSYTEHYKCSRMVNFYRHMVIYDLTTCLAKDRCQQRTNQADGSRKGRNLLNVRDQRRSIGSDRKRGSGQQCTRRPR